MMAIWKMSNVREILAYICQISSQWNSTWLNMSNKLTRLIWKWHFRWKDILSCIWRSDPCADQELKLSSTPNCPLDSDALLLADLAWFQAKLLRSVKANIVGKWLVLVTLIFSSTDLGICSRTVICTDWATFALRRLITCSCVTRVDLDINPT